MATPSTIVASISGESKKASMATPSGQEVREPQSAAGSPTTTERIAATAGFCSEPASTPTSR